MRYKHHFLAKHLRAMEEPSLWTESRRDPGVAVYRFLEFPSMGHPVAIRITRTSAGASLRAVVLDGLGAYGPGGMSYVWAGIGFNPGEVGLDRTASLTPGEWQELERRVAALLFWGPGSDQNVKELVTNGNPESAQFVLEGVRGGEYQFETGADDVDEYIALRNFVRSLVDLGP